MTKPDTSFERSARRFRRFGILTIASVFFLIFVGSLVRSTGAGMGCPDWPKCFGEWIPPTDVSELPTNYQEIYKDHGYASTEFNVYKTWTEYINRLIGVIIGFLIFLTVIFSIPFLKKDKPVFWLSFIAFILVGFQGWLGAQVVATNLADWMVTVHMIVALLIVSLLIYTITRSQSFIIKPNEVGAKQGQLLKRIAVGSLLVSLIQVVSGTQVREKVDYVASLAPREDWIAMLGEVFELHRLLSWLVCITTVVLFINIRKGFAKHSLIQKASLSLLILIALQIICGIALAYLAVPPIAQMFHLLLGSLSIGVLLFISLMLYNKVSFQLGAANNRQAFKLAVE